mmetsp:Transcript_3705/g.9277  ORF Transcript_3705/g.9277 Transcript_3705/m.9277 type:complete len:447 (+) Transcript_3705:86-1426(+)
MAGVEKYMTKEFVQENLGLVAAVVVGTVGGVAFLMSSGNGNAAKADVDVNVAPTSSKAKKKKKKAKKKAKQPAAVSEDDGADDEGLPDDSDADDLEVAVAVPAPAKAKKNKKKNKAKGSGKAEPAVVAAAPPKMVKAADAEPAPAPAPAAADDGAWETAKPAKRKKDRTQQAPNAAKPLPKAAAGAPETSSIKKRVEIAAKRLGIIIGPGGETLHKLQDATGTKIDTPRKGDDGGSTAVVIIDGPADGVSVCARAVRDLAAKGYSTITHPGFSEGSVQMLPMYFHILIGKAGVGIRGLQDRFNIKVAMPETKVSMDDTKAQYVKLVGAKADIERAKADIKAMMRCYYSPTLSPHLTHIELDLGPNQLRDLIGHRGSTIKSIQGDTKTTIHTPRAHSLNPKVVVVGSAADVARARTQIDRALERAVANREARANERFDDYAEDDEDW